MHTYFLFQTCSGNKKFLPFIILSLNTLKLLLLQSNKHERGSNENREAFFRNHKMF